MASLLLRRSFCARVPLHQRHFRLPTLEGGRRLFATGEVVISGEEFHRTGVDLHRKPNVPPLIYDKEVLVYQSTVDVLELGKNAQMKCIVGASLGMAGFGILLASVGASMSQPAFLMLLTIAGVNTYSKAIVSQRVVRRLAARHVDKIVILPTPQDSVPKAEEKKSNEDEDDSVSKLMSASATFEERLAVTPLLRLQVRTATAERFFSLVDIPEKAKTSKSQDFYGSNSLDGLPLDRRATFSDICKELKLLYACLEHGVCRDPSVLSALTNSTKVVTDEMAELRSDVGVLQSNPTPDTAGVLFSELTPADVGKVVGLGSEEPPYKAIDKIGRRALIAGSSVLVGACVFYLGENARDVDGVPRWHKLKLPF